MNGRYEVSELICLMCLHRAIHVYPTGTMLKNLECKCGKVGYLINTGQVISEDIKKKKRRKQIWE